MGSLVRMLLTSLGFFAALSIPPLGCAKEPIDFNRDIRPILSENCFYCHGQDSNKRQADLRLDLRESAITSQAIVPGKPSSSVALQRITSTNPDERMPPEDSNRRLNAEQKDLLTRWIEDGAIYQPHWAFVGPKRPEWPAVQRQAWTRNPIDRFVLSKLESKGLHPSPPADRSTLIKRLSIDLLGLPPSIEEVESFERDEGADAYERLVDRFLSHPAFGERLALPWLDAARYADSNGFQQDGDTWQWIWRDWLVDAINDDLPFDQFTIWQLAGDLLPNATVEQKIASGFNRNHLLNGEGGAIAEEQRFVNLFDRVDTTSTTWFGLTMACAQCHDHKYDPLTKRDYYGLLDAFNRVPETGTPQRLSARIRVAAPYLELPTEAQRKKIAEFEARIATFESESNSITAAAFEGWRVAFLAEWDSTKEGEAKLIDKGLSEPLRQLLRKGEKGRSEDENRTFETQLKKFFDEKIKGGILKKFPRVAEHESLKKELSDYRGDQIPRVMIMSDEKPRKTSILDRGEYLKPVEEVSFSTPEFLPPLPANAPRNRLGLAMWLVSNDHPLTSRVQVNRLWQHFFQVGIVKTSEDFGVQSEYPIHGELLDWLAVEFREKDWSTKEFIRTILLSNTYQQSSRITPELRTKDAENRLYARASRFRMPSMVLRDWALATSEFLDQRKGGAPVYPYQPDAVWEALAITKERDFTYPLSSGADLYRRSLYTFWRRTVLPTNMFDSSNRQTCRVRQTPTSTPLHALTTLNDPTWVEAARRIAERAMLNHATTERQLRWVFHRVLCRLPSPQELEVLERSYRKQRSMFEHQEEMTTQLLSVGESPWDQSLPPSSLAALAQVCLAILNLDEALSRE